MMYLCRKNLNTNKWNGFWLGHFWWNVRLAYIFVEADRYDFELIQFPICPATPVAKTWKSDGGYMWESHVLIPIKEEQAYRHFHFAADLLEHPHLLSYIVFSNENIGEDLSSLIGCKILLTYIHHTIVSNSRIKSFIASSAFRKYIAMVFIKIRYNCLSRCLSWLDNHKMDTKKILKNPTIRWIFSEFVLKIRKGLFVFFDWLTYSIFQSGVD